MGNCFVRHRSGKKKLKTRSLYSFCTNINQSGTYSETISGIKYDIECVTIPEVTDDNVDTIFNSVSSNEGYFLLLKTRRINITKTLTSPYPKKSLIIFCPTIKGTGTISMTSKGPNVLPEDILLFTESDPYKNRLLIPAYANNARTVSGLTGNDRNSANHYTNKRGIDGTGYNCGSGGCGGSHISNVSDNRANLTFISGSGYSYGGGAGTGGYGAYGETLTLRVDSTYPMRGGNAKFSGDYNATGGIGNPIGSRGGNKLISPSVAISGVGGRIIIFCRKLSDLTLASRGGFYNQTSYGKYNNSSMGPGQGTGGSSGGGSINIFYATSITNINTNVTSNISSCYCYRETGYTNTVFSGGAGGNGTVTKEKVNHLII